MPIKQVVCSICKETVNKAQTYHVGGTDRACKKHEGVVDKKAQLESEKEKARQMSVQKAEHRHQPSGFGSSADWSGDFMKPKCWVCMNTGMRAQEFFMKYLVECEKQSKITGKTVIPLLNSSVRLNERCIFILTKEMAQGALKYVRDDFRVMVDMAGAIAICADCCHVSGINPMPKVEFEDIVKFAPLSELVLRPAIQAEAARELARDN